MTQALHHLAQDITRNECVLFQARFVLRLDPIHSSISDIWSSIFFWYQPKTRYQICAL